MNPQVRDFNIRFERAASKDSEHAIDLRENPAQHNGFYAPNYWESIHSLANGSSELLGNLFSGAHSILNMHIASSYLDKAMAQREISVTFHSS